MCCGMFCLDQEVIFIHSKQVNKIGIMDNGEMRDNGNPEFASSDSKNNCTRTKNIFPPYLRLALQRWPFKAQTISSNISGQFTKKQRTI